MPLSKLVRSLFSRTMREPIVKKQTLRHVIEELEGRVVPAALHWLGTTSANWSVASNWQENAVPSNNDSLIFDSSVATFNANRFETNNDISGLTVALITINGTSAATNFNLTGNSLSVTTGITSTAANNATVSFASPGIVATAATTTFTSNGGALTIAANVNNSTSNAVAVAGSGSVFVSGVIDGAATTVTTSGTVTLTLAGLNSYTGLTTVGAGTTVKLGTSGSGANGPFGTTDAGTTITAGGTLDLNGFSVGTNEALTIRGTGVSSAGAIANSSAATGTYVGPLTLGADSTIKSASGAIVLSNTGPVTGSTFALTLDGTATGSSLAGVLATTAATAITKTGAGTWTLSGNSTFATAVTISAGTLKLGASGDGTNSPLGTVEGITSVSATGAALDLNGVTLSTAEPVTIAGTGVSGVGAITNSAAGAVSFGGLLTLGNAATIAANNGAVTFSNAGLVTGAFALTLDGTTAGNSIASVLSTAGISVIKNGSGAWTLGGNNAYTGATTVNAGTLTIAGAPTGATASTVNSGGTLTVTGALLGNASTTVNLGGTLNLDYTSGVNLNKLNDAATLTVAGGTVNLIGGATAEAVALAFNAGSSTIARPSGASTLSGTVTRAAGALLDIGAGLLTTTTSTSNSLFVSSSSGIYATVAGADWAFKNGSNLVVANAAYSPTTGTSLGGSGNQSDVAAGVDSTLSLDESTSTLRFNQNEARTITIASGKTLTLTQGGILVTGAVNPGSGTSTISGGTIKPGSNDALQIIQNSPKGLTIGSVIANATATALTKGGSGTLTLTGVNLFTGAIYVDSGTLEIGGAGSLGNGNYSGAINLAAGTTFNVTSSASQILGSVPAGAGVFNWNPSASSATLTLNANRGATPSTTTIASGSMAILLTNLGSGAASDLVLDGGTLRFLEPSSGNNYTTSKLFTLGTGGATLQPFTLDQANNTRRAEFTSTSPIAFTGSGPRTLKFESGVMLGARFAPAIGDGPGGATSVVMGGTAGAGGTWTLEGANSYTGTTTVNGGSLVIRKAQAVNGGTAYFTPANVGVAAGATLAVGVGAAPTYFTAADVATILDGSHLGASAASTGLKTGAQFGLDTTAGDFNYSAPLADLSGGNVLNFAKHGINTLTLSGNNTYTGTTTIFGDVGTSILRAGSSTAFGQPTTASVAFSLGDFFSVQKLQLNGNNVTLIGLNNPVSTWRDGSGEQTIESGSSDTSGTGVDVLTVNTAVSTTSTWNNAQALNGGISRIQDGGARKLALTKGGDGAFALGGANRYTGGTIVNGGILRALSSTAFGGATGVEGTIAFGPGSTGTLQLNGQNNTIASLNSDNGSPGTTFVENGHASTAATLTISGAASSTYAGTMRNGSAAALTLVKAGAGSLTLSGNLSYTGTTTVNGGSLILAGSNASATGDITVGSGAAVQFNTTSSINGGTLALNRDVTVNLGGVAGFGPSFGAGITDVQTALANRIVANSAGAIAADNYANSNFNFSTAGLTAASLGAIGNVTYSGTLTPSGTTYRLGGGPGVLTFNPAITGSVNLTVATGSVILASSGNNYSGTTTVSGGILTLASGATLGNNANLVMSGTGILDLGGNSITVGTVNISNTALIRNGTLNGTSYSANGGTITAKLTGAGALTVNGNSVTLNNAANDYSGGTNITSGTLFAIAPGSLGSNSVTLAGGALALSNDGDGTSSLETFTYGNPIILSMTNPMITVGKAGVTGSAANKTLRLGALTFNTANATLKIVNNNGFGLEFTGATTLHSTTVSSFDVGGGSNAPVVQGLTLSGIVSGSFGLTKLGSGTLVLNNSSNNFSGAVTISTGLLSVTSDAALGAAGNVVSLNGGANVGIQLAGTGDYAHQINTTVASGVIDVPQGVVANLTTRFNGGASAGLALTKQNNGVLNLSADNTSGTAYTGVITINGGVLRVSNAGALGSTAGNTIVSSNVGSAVQINGVSTAEPFSVNNAGFNGNGAIENISGANDLTGVITLASAATIGATSGTLNVKGGIAATTLGLTFAGPGVINVTTNAITGTSASLVKNGTGTTTISLINAITGTVNVNAGTLTLNNTAALGATGVITLNSGGTLTLDNGTTNANNRLGGRPITLAGGTLNFIGNGTTEAVGALTPNPGQDTIAISGTGTLSFASMAARQLGSSIVITGSGPAVQFVATTTVTDGLLMGTSAQSAANFFNGEFATSAGTANAPLSAYASYAGGDLGAAATSTTVNIKPSGTQTATPTKSQNSLALAGGVGVVIQPGQTLTLDSGGLINNGGGAITGGTLTSTLELSANYVTSGAINSIVTGGNFTKSGAGTLTLGNLALFTGNTAVNGGTLTLGGGNNTLVVNKALLVNAGATLDLGSNNQYVAALSSTNAIEGTGGAVIGTGTLTMNAGASTFAGNLGSGSTALNVVKAGSGVLTLVSANDTTGTLAIVGGGITLKDGGTLLNLTGTVAIRNATLLLDDAGSRAVADRIADGRPITLDGGTIQLMGRSQFNSTETVGAVAANSGYNQLTAQPAGTGVNSAVLTLTSLTRAKGAIVDITDGSINFTNVGQIGNVGRVVVSGVAPTAVGGIVPGYFIGGTAANGPANLAAYSPGLGFGAVNQTGFPTASATFAAAVPTDNVQGGGTVAAGGQTINSHNGAGGANISFVGANDLLTVTSGMLAHEDSTATIGTTALPGALTSGQSELFLFKVQQGSGGQWIVNSSIVDNPAMPGTSVALVAANFTSNTGQNLILSGANTYSGGTYVNSNAAGNILGLSGAAGVIVIPYSSAGGDLGAHGLVINNATVAENVNAGQIDPRNFVTLNGGGSLTLTGNNTLAGLVFNSNGGILAPTVTPSGVLTITGDVTSNPSNVMVTPTISGGTLDLNGGTRNVTVAALLENSGVNGAGLSGLTISSAIQNGSLTKKGPGVLTLSGTNTFAGQLTVENGALSIASMNNVNANGTLGNSGLPVILGAASTSGTLEYTGGSVTSTKPLTLAASGGALQIDTASAVLTLSGTIDGSGSLTKSGLGAVLFNTAKTYTGTTNVQNGTLTLSVTNGLSAAAGLTLGAAGANNTATLNLGNGGNSFNLVVAALSSLGTSQSNDIVTNLSTGTGTATLTVNPSAASIPVDSVFAGTIKDGTTAKVALTKAGSNTLTLTGANAYTGATTVSGGTLKLDFSAAGAPANNIVGASSAFAITAGTLNVTGAANSTNSQTFASASVTGSSSVVVNANASANPLLLALVGGITVNAGGSVNFTLPTGAQSATNGITTTNSINAAGILGGWATVGNDWATKSGANIVAYSGYVDVNRLGGTIGSSANNNVRIVETGGGTEVTPLATGTTDVSTLLQSASGNAVYNPGTTDILRLGASGGVLLASNAGDLTIGSSANDGQLTAGGAATTAGAINLTNLSATKNLTVNSAIVDNGAAVSVGIGGDGHVLLEGTNTNTGGLAKGGAGVLDIDGANASPLTVYAGTTNVNAAGSIAGAVTVTGGTLNLNAASNLSGATVTVTGGSVTYAADNAIADTSIVTVNGGTLNIGAFSDTIDGSNLLGASGGTISGTTGVLTSTTTFGARVGTISAILSGNVGLNKLGNGNTLVLAGLNTFTGNVVVGNSPASDGGTLSVSVLADKGQPSNLGLNSDVYILSDSGQGGKFQYTGNSISVDRGLFFRSPNSGGANVTFEMTQPNVTLGLTGPGSWGSGTYALNANATGLSTLNLGTISSDSTSTDAGNFTTQATLNVNIAALTQTVRANANSPNFLFAGPNNSIGNITFTTAGKGVSLGGAGTTTLSGTNSYTGTTTISNGVVKITGTMGNSAINVNANGKLVLQNAGAVNQNLITLGGAGSDLSETAANALSGSAALTLNNATATATLSQPNTYAGSTTITLGSLTLTNSLAAQNSPVTVTAANGLKFGTAASSYTVGGLLGAGSFALQDTASAAIELRVNAGTIPGPYSGVLSGPGSLTKLGAGELGLTGVNTYTGVTTVSGGTLAVGPAGSINGTSGVTISGGRFSYNSATALSKPISFSGTGGTLSGSGVIGTAVNVASGNTLAPGNSIGAFTINNSLALSGVSSFEINAATMTSDKVVGVTSLTYGGNLQISNLGGTLVAGQSWDLFDFTSQIGAWANAASFIGVNDYSGPDLPTLTGHLSYQFNYGTGVLSVIVSVAPPTVTSVAPFVGPTTGGDVVVITGTNFSAIEPAHNPAAVKFGSGLTFANALNYTVNSATQITATTPPGANTVNVVITAPDGSSANDAVDGTSGTANDYSYTLPTVTSVVINGGPVSINSGNFPTATPNIVTLTGVTWNNGDFTIHADDVSALVEGQFLSSTGAGFPIGAIVTAVDPFNNEFSMNINTVAAQVTPTTVGAANSVAAKDAVTGRYQEVEGQSSIVQRIVVTFNMRVTLDANNADGSTPAFNVTSLATSVTALGIAPTAADVAVSAVGVPGTGSQALGYTQYVLNFVPGAGVKKATNAIGGAFGNAFTTLRDGVFQLNTVGASIHAGLGNTASDRADPFWALFGAVNAGDVKITGALGGQDDTLLVDGLALNDTYATFGSTIASAGPPTYRLGFDWNLDGNVDGIDLSHLYANFGTIWKI